MELVRGVLASLRDNDCPSSLDIIQCGPAILPLLVSAFSSSSQAETLLALANEHIQNTPFNFVERRWLRLYTDASIALALNHADGVRILDMSIIVAGALGDGRMDCIQALIKYLQGPAEALTCTRRMTPEQGTAVLSDTIPSISPPSLHAYRTNCTLPFILRGYLNWPALEKWKSIEYLRHVAGPSRVVPVERGTAYDHPDWGQEIIPWSDFIQMMSTSNVNPPYLAQYALLKQFPDLEGDITIPDYVWSDPDIPHTLPAEPLVNVWIGNGADGIVSPPHTDPYFNCYAQVLGEKRVWLAPPDAEIRPYGDSDDFTGYMRNTSPLKVFESEQAGMYATLHPGDLLIFPPLWWHAMKAQGPGIVWNISIWY